MSLTLDQLGKLGADTRNNASGITDAAKGMFSGSGSSGSRVISNASAYAHTPSLGGKIARFAFAPIKFFGGLAFKVVELPLAFAVKITRVGANSIAGIFIKAPKLAWIGTGVLAAAGIGSWMQHRKEAQSGQYYQQQAANLQAGPAYMNSVSPAESAQMEAMMKQSGQNGSFADAAAQRAAAANAQSV